MKLNTPWLGAAVQWCSSDIVSAPITFHCNALKALDAVRSGVVSLGALISSSKWHPPTYIAPKSPW